MTGVTGYPDRSAILLKPVVLNVLNTAAPVGHSKDDPEWRWVDTYSAIKTSNINAVFVCYIARPGADPEFQLHLNGVAMQHYDPDRLGDALKEWRAIATRAAADDAAVLPD
jgi:hypothetical protein